MGPPSGTPGMGDVFKAKVPNGGCCPNRSPEQVLPRQRGGHRSYPGKPRRGVG